MAAIPVPSPTALALVDAATYAAMHQTRFESEYLEAILATLGLGLKDRRRDVNRHPMNTSYASWWYGQGVEVFADFGTPLTVTMPDDDPRWVNVRRVGHADH